MRTLRFALLLTAAAALLLAACTGESQLPEATGKGIVRAINAISTSPDIVFRIEERTIASLSYKVASSGARYDDLEYTFNFDADLGGEAGLTRIASFPLDVIKDTSYTFVVSGSLAAPDITLWELVGAYRALANKGAWSPLSLEPSGASGASRTPPR